MELVSSYFSDEEMENHSNQEKAVKKNSEDRNSSEDSDALDIVFEKTIPAAVKSQKPKPANNEIECICLDDSDSDNLEVSFSSVPSKSNASFPTIKQEVSKKIDYLNLDSSDTDDEQERIQNNVNNLLSSAAILNDIECGPTKPVPDLDISATLPSCTDDASPGRKRPSSPSASVTSNHDNKENITAPPAIDISAGKICSQEDLSNKKIKSDPVTTDSADVNVSTVDGLEHRIRMYRKDERIIAAYKKKDKSHIPSTLSQTITAHQKAVSSLSWCAAPYSHLLLSSSLDSTVKVWDIYYQNKPIQTLDLPLGVRAATWSKDGEQIIAGGFGKQAHVFDVLSGKNNFYLVVDL
ncbi:hypothetical protein AVEN_70088-1 [Araneus ventricosus]|uniref:Uncharacterized protein n=1 Tax=Araneus ventricosus TaxID=182803 RepID=A0A4Y2N6B1_ARAVE|nr:hypothetical protein AVEN_70088-1 [Araneus ventricosus]